MRNSAHNWQSCSCHSAILQDVIQKDTQNTCHLNERKILTESICVVCLSICVYFGVLSAVLCAHVYSRWQRRRRQDSWAPRDYDARKDRKAEKSSIIALSAHAQAASLGRRFLFLLHCDNGRRAHVKHVKYVK